MHKVIKTAREHTAAVAQLSALMDADPAPGSAQADDLELLAHLIEDYEKKHHDFGLPDPRSAITFRMKQQGLSRKDMIPYFGSPSRVSEVLNGKRPLTIGMIRKLHRELGIPAESLLSEPGREEMPPEVPVECFPLKEMFQRGWFSDFKGTWQQAKAHAEELVTHFFCFGVEPDALPAMNRQMKPAKAAVKEDQYALLAWRTRVLCRAGSKDLSATFDPGAITPEFLRHLVGLSMHKTGPRMAVDLLEGHGIAVMIEPRLEGTHLDGAALLLPIHRQPVIGLTLRHDRLDHFWFCLLHEVGHVVKHLATGQAEGFLDNLEVTNHEQMEREADEFALDTLIPRAAWQRFWKAGVFDPVTVQREAKRLLVHGAILAGRIRKEANNYRLLSRLINQYKARPHFEAEPTLRS